MNNKDYRKKKDIVTKIDNYVELGKEFITSDFMQHEFKHSKEVDTKETDTQILKRYKNNKLKK